METPTPKEALVLLVDDFSDALEMYQEYLTFKGYHVAIAHDGAEAIAAARAARPALIFMDIRMPRMTGTEAMRVLRSDPALRRVPIVAFTAHALADEVVAALEAGFDEVIPKPCNPDALIAAIERLIHAQSQQSGESGTDLSW